MSDPLRPSLQVSVDDTRKSLEKMSHEEKMQIIDRDVRKLQARSVKYGYSALQVQHFASHFFQAKAKARRDTLLRRALGVAVAVLLGWVLLQFKSTYGLVVFLARVVQIKTLAVWEWTEVYHSNCLLSNPLYHPPDDLTTKHCQICEGLDSIDHVHNVSGREMLDRFFQRDVPVVVEDGLQGWADVKVRTARDVAELFEEDHVLASSAGCAFSSNLAGQYGDHRALLRSVLTDNTSHYYAHWENCEGRAGKAIRSVFRRPHFLAPALQIALPSWILLSHSYPTSIFKQVDIQQPLILLLQMSGRVRIQVEAWRPCQELCPLLHTTLLPGQALAVTEFLWKVSYLPSPEGESVTVGLGGSF